MKKLALLLLLCAVAQAQTYKIPREDTGLDAARPATCTVPQHYVATDTGRFSICPVANSWAQVFAAIVPGSDIGATINAAATALGKGIIYLPAGSFTYATGINVDGAIDIQIIGQGGQTAGADGATQIIYTGTGSPVSARSTYGFRLSYVQIEWNNAGMAAPVVDLSHSALASDTAWAEVDHCSFFKRGSGAVAPVIINADKAIDSHFHNNTFQNYTVGIRGAVDNTSYSNANTVDHNNFSSTTGTAGTAHIQNPVSGWDIRGNTFEMGTAGGQPNVVGFTGATAAANAQGINFVANWIGDTTAASTLTVLDVGGGGWNISGNFLNASTGGSATLVSIRNSTTGVNISGNYMNSSVNALVVGTSVANLNVTGNQWGVALTNFVTGTPVSGSITDNTGKMTVYGGLASGSTGVTTVGQTTVGALPAASSNAGAMILVTDSTTVSAEGQTCVGSSSSKALAVSNGTAWKCF